MSGRCAFAHKQTAVLDNLWASFVAKQAIVLVQLSVHAIESQTRLHGCPSLCQVAIPAMQKPSVDAGLPMPTMSVAKYMDMTLESLTFASTDVKRLATMHRLTTCLLFHLHAFLTGCPRTGNSTPFRHVDTVRCKRALMPVYFAISSCLSLLSVAWQLRGGQRRAKRARHALQILPSLVAVTLVKCVSGTIAVQDKVVLQDFLLQQLCLNCRPCPPNRSGGSLYALLCKNTYVGKSELQNHACWGRDPLRRFVEHLSCPPLRMRKDPPATVGYVWLHDASSKEDLAVIEAAHISQSQPTANRTFKVERDVRLPGSGRNRPHKRLRIRRAVFFDNSAPRNPPLVDLAVLEAFHLRRCWPPAVPRNRDSQNLRQNLTLPFLVLYDLVRRAWCVTLGLQATVLHYASSVLLLTQRLCTKGSCVDWSVVRRHWGDSIVHKVAACVLAHPRPGYKRRGLSVLSNYLRQACELPFKTVVLKLPSFARTGKVNQALRRVAVRLSRGVPERWHWLQGHLKFVVLPKVSIKMRRFNMQRVMRTACWAEYEALTDEELTHALSGNGMQRIKRWTKFPDIDQPLDGLGPLKLRLRGVCHQLRFNPQERTAFSNAILGAVGGSLHRSALLQPLQEYATTFPKAGAGICLVQEDKDSAACWKMPCFAYQARMCHLLATDRKWLPTTLSLHEAALLRAQTINGTKLSSGKMLRASPDPSHVPYGYGTVKAKCFQGSVADGWRHTCSKSLHSCFRKIVSWGRCEANVRRTFRQVARATTLLVSKYCLGWETLNLKTSVTDLRRCLSKLDVGCTCCPKCGVERKLGISLLVADAGQMYEQIEPSDVLANLHRVVRSAQGDGYEAVVLLKCKKLLGSLCRSSHVVVDGADVWPFRDLIAILELSLHEALLHVRWGDRIMRQASGSPIGGLMSRLHAMLALGPAEVDFVRCAASPKATEMAAVRYVDDLLLVSTWCLSCFKPVAGQVYPEHIRFDIEQASYTNVNWLDISVKADKSDVVIDVQFTEEAWLSGNCEYPDRQRWPPYLHEASFNMKDFKQRVKAIASRWQQIGLSESQLKFAVAHLMATLARLEYPQNLVIKGLCRHSCPSVAAWVKYWRDHLSEPSARPRARVVRFYS